MRNQMITIAVLGFLMGVAGLFKSLYYPHLAGNSAYLFLSLLWVAGIVIAILGLNMLWRQASTRRVSQNRGTSFVWPNRRKNFRIIYPAHIRPSLIVEMADGQPRRHLQYQVVDLSEEGICFIDDGSLGPIESFSGYLRLKQSDNVRVTARVIRRLDDHICVQLQGSLAWRTILQEQRRILAQIKPAT